jgi:uncharacterized small protein (DUF1192 family)
MDWDETREKPASGPVVGENLENLSVAELEARIAILKAEIDRVSREAEAKRRHEQAASDIFKSKK